MKSPENNSMVKATSRSRFDKYRLLKIIFASALSTFFLTGYSQDSQNGYSALQNVVTDQSLVDAIAPYDADVRQSVLVASQYPDVLEKLAQIRNQTSNAFQQTIQGYAQKKQNWFYEISRYPNLMDQLASLPRKQSRQQIESLLNNPSDELKETAWKLYDKHHKDLVAINNLNRQAVSSFQELINPLSRNAQNAFKTLQEMPDVLSLLNDHIDISSQLGERYRNDPAGVDQEIAALHDKLEEQSKQELAAYQNELSQDPKAMQELSRASKDYASTGGYSYPAPTGEKVINYGSPYSYWFGYPFWYNSPMWYPGAFGYGSGIYFGLGGYPSFYGFPSLGFSRWFFGGAYRYYPNLYRQYGRYYRESGARSRYISPGRSAFIGSAGRHFSPNISGRSYQSNGNRAYRGEQSPGQSRSRMAPSQNYRQAPQRSNSYRVAPNTRSYNSPSFGGANRNGFSGGGMRGGSSRGGRR
ncbi:hypothetical protein [Dyadobacter psychrotolerans]|uniref:DUF3300 domain-containing protein n=1 Tax=Dyadobacter psychrotolerans TaxID=2541721 RepID=A0A4R5DUL7_9BACT|nr:hypothetical protein [Dyadobacter psychrotolerans]TDE14653.1 hypothetical protein E0F88_15805 [Dyadobacter psychrotolerans]